MAAAAAASEVRVASRRIVDYLNDGEELGVEGAGAEAPPCTPAAAGQGARSVRPGSVLPRFRWPRLVSLGRKGGAAKGKGKEVVVVEKGDDPPRAGSTSAREPAAATDAKHSDLGVGLSLVFLLAKTSDEFNKMVKVRTEMEALLKEIRDEVRSKDRHGDAPKASNRESTTSSCVTDGNDRSSSAGVEYQAGTSSGVEPASCEKSFQDGGCSARMDVLEEEFHAELGMLKVNYGSETPSFLPEEGEEEHYSEPYDVMAGYGNGVDDDSGEVVEDEEQDDDDGDDDNACYNGVSAVELERRLHELLHERNRDRIEELEAALQRAEKKLVEKEMEVSLWKDTAKLALRQDNELQ
ncbi:hypothetical protein PAHAL_4G066600 [Panicum hallii]|uniref:Uncharacterized protein n=1 Tax=Panicum hallii TaxID=206008 RepID=A0A2S3HHL3_9POAL|nr:protein POLAR LOCALIZATION DURING ASYMMETRIC DIVISION AND REDISTRIBUTION-like isoform X2 [Panicum hallii]PAN23096.1 hypothetical protein PAHAL_4G066600 [Panicum hallii]